MRAKAEFWSKTGGVGGGVLSGMAFAVELNRIINPDAVNYTHSPQFKFLAINP